ncbi:hypothetical protein GX441_11495 [bacterium]|nr:hypothetical protein [bacterium]
MFNLFFLVSLLFTGVLKESFRIADAEQKHHQVYVRAAMASDGRFAIAWIDSLKLPVGYDLNLFIRFFDKDGKPLTDPYKISKLEDTNWIYHPFLDMDNEGNTVLVWGNNPSPSVHSNGFIRSQSFNPLGTPSGPARTLLDYTLGPYSIMSIDLANNGEFVLPFEDTKGETYGIWFQRFELDGTPKDSAVLAFDGDSFPLTDSTDMIILNYHSISLNDSGDVVVTVTETHLGSGIYDHMPRYQVFNRDDESILPWNPTGYRVNDSIAFARSGRAEPQWFDNDRFAVFWLDWAAVPAPAIPLLSRVFSSRGAVAHPICLLDWVDPRYATSSDAAGRFSIGISPDDRFAFTYDRAYKKSWNQFFHRATGFLGEIKNNEPSRTTATFEYDFPLGSDTATTGARAVVFPAVAASDDRILWVYSRFNSDTIFEAWATVTDWNMVGIAEHTETRDLSPLSVTSIGSTITLSYSNCPNGFSASVYDATGRRVDELRSSQTHGTIQWGGGRGCYWPGVYFIVPQVEKASPSKVVLVR